MAPKPPAQGASRGQQAKHIKKRPPELFHLSRRQAPYSAPEVVGILVLPRHERVGEPVGASHGASVHVRARAVHVMASTVHHRIRRYVDRGLGLCHEQRPINADDIGVDAHSRPSIRPRKSFSEQEISRGSILERYSGPLVAPTSCARWHTNPAR